VKKAQMRVYIQHNHALRGRDEHRCDHHEFDHRPTHTKDDFWSDAKALGYVSSGERRAGHRRSCECWQTCARQVCCPCRSLGYPKNL